MRLYVCGMGKEMNRNELGGGVGKVINQIAKCVVVIKLNGYEGWELVWRYGGWRYKWWNGLAETFCVAMHGHAKVGEMGIRKWV